ncbi:hypothetical protein ES288_D05G070800v1 [Gossypium darwinii]|nr:hypothetical protein ES288_D05G070800v1 [Gossypium darwinii]TYG67363.1 hypothetical protein ES288_D05G070800v1 [Gossypium darwinii]
MPRKVNCGIDYDDGYDDDFDDYDYGYDVEENVKEPSLQDTIKRGVWRCSVCTYDNDDTMSSCDICGILRSPSVSNGTYDEKRTAPFKFDVPSPDDLVSNGLHSSAQHSKGKDKHGGIIFSKNLEINPSSGFKASDKSSASMAKGRVEDSDGRSVSNNLCSSGQSSSSLMPKERTDMVEDGSSLTHGGEGYLTSNLKNMTLGAKSGNSKDIKANSRAQYKPEKWMFPEKAEGSLTQLNLAIVGHVDSGKSTLSGRLLHLLGRISQKEMHKYEKESKLQGKGSFAYAWALDESAEERERGVTMTVAVTYLDSKRYHVVVLDSPGHKDFVPNMITGATPADAAILVIDASIGSFEAGMDGTKGQTREHAQLIRSFGVDQIIVAVNKMDAVEYSKDRFDLIKSQLGTFLRSCDFKDSSVTWIPLSAVENQNLVVAPSDVRLSW